MKLSKEKKALFSLIAGIILAIVGLTFIFQSSIPAKQARQVAFLKEHEDEITEYIKLQEFYMTSENEKTHPEVKKVNFDYDNYEAYRRDAGGIPYNFYTIRLSGHYNDTEEFELLIDINSSNRPTKILNIDRY